MTDNGVFQKCLLIKYKHVISRPGGGVTTWALFKHFSGGIICVIYTCMLFKTYERAVNLSKKTFKDALLQSSFFLTW